MSTLQFDIPAYVENQLPPMYRLPKFRLLFIACLYAVQWRFENWKEYQDGAAWPPYNPAHSYAAGERCMYLTGNYESLTAGNTGNNPATNATNWILINGDFIGMTERLKYNGKIITLTWALNRHFGTQWRNLPWPAPYDFGTGTGTYPDIYITTVVPAKTSFLMHPTADKSSRMYPTGSTGLLINPPLYAIATTYAFTVHVPIAVYNAQGSTDAIRSAVFNQFINKYKVVNTNFTIATY